MGNVTLCPGMRSLILGVVFEEGFGSEVDNEGTAATVEEVLRLDEDDIIDVADVVDMADTTDVTDIVDVADDTGRLPPSHTVAVLSINFTMRSQ